MKKVIREKGENRKDYLYRVAIEFLKISNCDDENIIYDEVECGKECLIEEMEIELRV